MKRPSGAELRIGGRLPAYHKKTCQQPKTQPKTILDRGRKSACLISLFSILQQKLERIPENSLFTPLVIYKMKLYNKVTIRCIPFVFSNFYT